MWHSILKGKHIDVWQDSKYTYIKFFDGQMKCQVLNKEAKEFIDFIKKDIKKIDIEKIFDSSSGITKWAKTNKIDMEHSTKNLKHDVCPLCHKSKDLIPHHERYEPEKKKDICQSCHIKVHRGVDYHTELRPKGVQGNKWNHYKSGKPRPQLISYKNGKYKIDWNSRKRHRKKGKKRR